VKRKARVYVSLKPSVFDPQGKTVEQALHSMGYGSVSGVRQGKYFEIEIDTETDAAARATVEEMAHRLLANPVIESYRVELL